MNAGDVVRVAGCTYRQLEVWSNNGWLQATNQGAGTGQNRDYPYAEVRVAVKLTKLVGAGVRPAVAAKIARGDAMAAGPLLDALLPPSTSVCGPGWVSGISGPNGPERASGSDLEAVS